MAVRVLNEFLPPAEDIRLGAIKIGDTLDINNENVLNVDSSEVLGTYYSNCITEIPQNIKLELNNGVLTLKAGSKVYAPNGADTFTVCTNDSDITYTPTWGNGYQCFLCVYTDRNGTITNLGMCRSDLQFSGSSQPSSTTTGAQWYDTTNNYVKRYDGSSWDTSSGISLYIGIVTVGTGNVITSIDQVFNGTGYIGHHVFVLPGVRGLIANGKTEKSTVKSIVVNTTNVIVEDTYQNNLDFNNGVVAITNSQELARYTSYKAIKPSIELQPTTNMLQYVYDNNINYVWDTTESTYLQHYVVPIVELSIKSGIITYFNIFQPLRIANANEMLDTTGTFLFDYKWSDHMPNKLSWVDASTFSWQDGNLYKDAYNELYTAWNGTYTLKADNGVTYRDTAKGYQIADVSQEANVISAWNSQHTGWFYILDTTNTRFKLPRLASKEIVETYRNGTNWYRIYADDWIEQGGVMPKQGTTASINTLIPMADTNYTVRTQEYENGSTDTDGVDFVTMLRTKTTTNMSFSTVSNRTNFWTVSGFSNIQYTNQNGSNDSVTRPFKHLYFYLGYTDIDTLKKDEVAIEALITGQADTINHKCGAVKGTLQTAQGQTNSTANTWTTEYNWTAPCNCWVHLYLSGIVTSGGTRAGAISINGAEMARNAVYNSGRDFSVGPVYAMVGQTVQYKFVEATSATLKYVEAY